MRDNFGVDFSRFDFSLGIGEVLKNFAWTYMLFLMSIMVIE